VKTIRIPADGANSPATTGTAPRSGVSQPPVANRAPTALSANQPAPMRTASIPTTTPEALPSGQYVQVSSQRSEEDARASFRALQQKYPSVLGNRQPVIRTRDLGGDRGVRYRVQIGPFASADQANNLCENLKSAGGQCYVLRE
jgi:cell division septation protein DedD